MQPSKQSDYSKDRALARRWTAAAFALVVIANLVLAGLALGWRTSAHPQAPDLTPSAWLTAPAPTMAELQGQVVLMAFLRSGDPGAGTLLERLTAWDSHYGPVGLQVIAVQLPERDFETDSGEIKALLGDEPPFPVAWDGDLSCVRRYDIERFPMLVLVDRPGRIRQLFEDVDRTGDLEQALWELLAESSH